MRATSIEPLLLTLLAGISIWDGVRIIRREQETVGGIEAGGWIALIGVLLIVATAAYWYHRVKRKIGGGSDWALGENVHLVGIALAIILAFVLLLARLGYLLCSALFFVAYLRFFGRYKWLPVLVGSIAFAMGSALLWAKMDMMMPQGVIPWP